MSEERDRGGACERCGEKPATVHVRRVSAGTEEDLHVCPDCARDLGAGPVATGEASVLGDPLTVLFQSMQETSGSTAICAGCGLSFERFRETGRLGCGTCYETFADELRPLIRRIQGAVRHRGKSPGVEPADERTTRIRRLQDELERAVVTEDYERAARIRDDLRELGEPDRPVQKERR